MWWGAHQDLKDKQTWCFSELVFSMRRPGHMWIAEAINLHLDDLGNNREEKSFWKKNLKLYITFLFIFPLNYNDEPIREQILNRLTKLAICLDD